MKENGRTCSGNRSIAPRNGERSWNRNGKNLMKSLNNAGLPSGNIMDSAHNPDAMVELNHRMEKAKEISHGRHGEKNHLFPSGHVFPERCCRKIPRCFHYRESMCITMRTLQGISPYVHAAFGDPGAIGRQVPLPEGQGGIRVADQRGMRPDGPPALEKISSRHRENKERDGSFYLGAQRNR